MKTKLISIIRPILYVAFGLSLVFACQKINPLDGVELTVNNDVYISPILVRAVNADMNSSTIPSNAVATISGEGANFVVDDLGNKGSSIKMVNGVLTLNLLPEANPSPSKPIIFNVFVQCDGFVSSNQTIRITGTEGNLKVYVPLVGLSAPPSGVTVAKQTASVTSGVTKSAIQVTAPVGNSKTESAVISIPAGTQLQDANGSAINASSLNMQIAHFGTTTPQSIQSFPGGFIAENATTIDGKKQPVTFQTAGFVSINMDAGGKAVKNFSTPIDVAVGVNKDLVNPITNTKIKENDTVPVWSLNEETGAWKEEGVATIVKDASGNLVANFKAKHLSCWNLDWSWPYFGGFGDCANATLKINVKSNLTAQQAIYPYEVQIQRLDGSYLAGLHSQEMYDGLSLIIPRMPAIEKAKIVVYNTRTWKVVAETSPFSPCTVGTVQVNITETPPPPPITLNIDFTAKCSNKNVVIRPSQWVYFLETGVWEWKYGYLNQGKLTVQVAEGVDYYVYAYYGGNFYVGVGKFSKTGSTFVPFGVSGLTGNITYDAASNSATLNAVYTSKSCK
jgi:hypothetical protein